MRFALFWPFLRKFEVWRKENIQGVFFRKNNFGV